MAFWQYATELSGLARSPSAPVRIATAQPLSSPDRLGIAWHCICELRDQICGIIRQAHIDDQNRRAIALQMSAHRFQTIRASNPCPIVQTHQTKFSSWILMPASFAQCFHAISVRLRPIVQLNCIIKWEIHFQNSINLNSTVGAAIPDRFFLLFIIIKLFLFFKYLFRAIFSPKICLPSGKTISSGKNDAEFVPQTSIDAGNA